MNARLYDPVLGRFAGMDPYVQLPDYTQSYNRYSYVLNNPLVYVDPEGEYALLDDLFAGLVGGLANVLCNIGHIKNVGHGFALFGIGFAGGITSIYCTPVVGGGLVASLNSIANQKYNNGKVKWDQVGIDALIGAGTAGVAMGVSQLITPVVSNFMPRIGGPLVQDVLVKGTTGAVTGFGTGTILAWGFGAERKDIWKQGLKGMSIGFTIGAADGTYSGLKTARTEGVSPWTGRELRVKPAQNHHFATDKNSKFTPEMKEIAAKYDLDLNGDLNKTRMPHQGRHPNAYHRWVLDQMNTIDATPGMNQQQFINSFDLNVKQPVMNNPTMLRKIYWGK